MFIKRCPCEINSKTICVRVKLIEEFIPIDYKSTYSHQLLYNTHGWVWFTGEGSRDTVSASALDYHHHAGGCAISITAGAFFWPGLGHTYTRNRRFLLNTDCGYPKDAGVTRWPIKLFHLGKSWVSFFFFLFFGFHVISDLSKLELQFVNWIRLTPIL